MSSRSVDRQLMPWISIIISFRFLAKSKTYTIINLLGLVLGLTAVFVLFTFLINELSFNRCFKESKRTYRVLFKDKQTGELNALTGIALAPSMQKYFPEIDKTGRIAVLINITGPVSVCHQNVYYTEPRFVSADPSILELFSIELKEIAPGDLLKSDYSLLISEKARVKYFGTTNPIGKTLKIKAIGKIFNFSVQGIYKDLPWNSSYQADFISNIGFLKEILREISKDPEASLNSFNSMTTETIIRLKDDIPVKRLEYKLPGFCKANKFDKSGQYLTFQNFRELYIHSGNIQNDFLPRGDPSNLIVYSSLAIFILLLAGINYSILSTARSALRFKEIGIKKVLGATRKQLRNQILTESILITFLALPLALLLLGLIYPFLKQFYGYEIHFDSGIILLYLLIFSGITLLIGVLSGIYVAMYLSSLDPLHALKIRLFSFRKFNLGKVFTVFQLFITLSLLISFITVYRQIRFCITQAHKIDKENLLAVNFNLNEFFDYSLLRKTMTETPDITSVSGISLPILSDAVHEINVRADTSSSEVFVFELYLVDYRFFETLGIPFISGSDFNITDTVNTKSRRIYNKTAANLLGYSDKPTKNELEHNNLKGIVEDFHIHSLHKKIKPTIFRLQPESCRSMLVRYKPGAKDQVIADIEKIWRQLAPELPFDYQLIDEEMDNLYTRDESFQFVVAVFTFLAFIITGMGLFGLAILLSERKLREVAIRKVFGASNPNIIYQMQKEFYRYIVIASILGVPLTWILMNRWLNTFYYHVDFSWFYVVVSILSVTVFVSLILFLRTRNVLKNNPLMSLKYE